MSAAIAWQMETLMLTGHSIDRSPTRYSVQMSTNTEAPALEDVTKAARYLAEAFGAGAASEARRRATNAGVAGSSAAELRWERIARFLDGGASKKSP